MKKRLWGILLVGMLCATPMTSFAAEIYEEEQSVIAESAETGDSVSEVVTPPEDMGDIVVDDAVEVVAEERIEEVSIPTDPDEQPPAVVDDALSGVTEDVIEEIADEEEEAIMLQTAAVKNGLIKEGGNLYYYVNGVKQKGQKKVDGYWYMFDSSTFAARTGFVYIPSQNKTCYYDANGRMQYGQKKIGGYWYNFKQGTGAMQIGFVKIPSQNKICYYDANGRMQYGQKKIDGYWYNFKQGTGAMQTGFVKIPSQNKICYYDANGRMQYGQKKINGYWYNFKQGSGAMQTGFVFIQNQGKVVYYNNNGQMQYGKIKVGGNTYTMAQGTGALQAPSKSTLSKVTWKKLSDGRTPDYYGGREIFDAYSVKPVIDMGAFYVVNGFYLYECTNYPRRDPLTSALTVYVRKDAKVTSSYYGDKDPMVRPGETAESIFKRTGGLSMMTPHKTFAPIGIYKDSLDANGLFVSFIGHQYG